MLTVAYDVLAGAQVMFPVGTAAAAHANHIIECSWDAQNKAWLYMRERHDKATPNAWRVYEKVVQSIEDNITPAALVGYIHNTIASSDMYQKERQWQAAASARLVRAEVKAVKQPSSADVVLQEQT